MTCYIDLLWAVNFGMDTIIMAVTARLIKKHIPLGRLFAGASLSAFIAVSFIIPPFAADINPFICSAITLLPAILISFRPTDLYDLLKQLFFLYTASFLLGGFIFSIVLSSGFYVFPQWEPYSIMPVAISALSISAVIFLTEKLLNTYISDRNLCCELKVHFMEKTVSGTGFTDTGNFLRDPLTGKPVVIASIHSIIGLFPKNCINDLINLSSPESVSKIFEDPNLASRFRTIPYSAFCEKQKIMPAFVSDFTEITCAKGKYIVIQNLTIGIAPDIFNLSTGSGFILNPEIFK